MEKTGALKRVIIFIKTIASENKGSTNHDDKHRIWNPNGCSWCNSGIFTSAILIAMGYSTYVAIALPAIGYDSLCTYAFTWSTYSCFC